MFSIALLVAQPHLSLRPQGEECDWQEKGASLLRDLFQRENGNFHLFGGRGTEPLANELPYPTPFPSWWGSQDINEGVHCISVFVPSRC